MKKIIILVLIIAIIIVGLFLYFRSYGPAYFIDNELSEPFVEEDYKIKDDEAGSYIIIERIGLTARVPDGWIAVVKGNNLGYWIEITSADLEGYPVIGQFCDINVGIVIDQKQNQRTRDGIKTLQENPEKNKDGFKFVLPGAASGSPILLWSSLDSEALMGQADWVSIPLGKDILLNLSIGMVSGYNDICYPIWEDFLRSVVIE